METVSQLSLSSAPGAGTPFMPQPAYHARVLDINDLPNVANCGVFYATRSVRPCVHATARPVRSSHQSTPVTRHRALQSRCSMARSDLWHAPQHALDRSRPELKPHEKKRTGLQITRSTQGLLLSSTCADTDEHFNQLSRPLRTRRKRHFHSSHTLPTLRTPRDPRTSHSHANTLHSDPSGHFRDGHARCIFHRPAQVHACSSEFGDAKSADPGQIVAHRAPCGRLRGGH